MFTNSRGAMQNFGSLKVSSLLVLVLVFVMLATTVAGCVQNARSVSGLKNQNRSAPWRLPVPSHSAMDRAALTRACETVHINGNTRLVELREVSLAL